MTLETTESLPKEAPIHHGHLGMDLSDPKGTLASVRSITAHDASAAAKAGLPDGNILLAQLGVPSIPLLHPGQSLRPDRVADTPAKSVEPGKPNQTEGPEYSPEKWNKDPQSANCYIYALNDFDSKYSTSYTDMDPGKLDYGDWSAQGGKALQKFANVQIEGAVEDGLKWTGNDSKAAPGFYKVALLVKPAGPRELGEDPADMHWARQDSDGFWSHKMGSTPVSDLDRSGKKITDPRSADFGPYKFVGYFDVPVGGIKLHRNEDDGYYPMVPTPKDLPDKAPPMPEAVTK